MFIRIPFQALITQRFKIDSFCKINRFNSGIFCNQRQCDLVEMLDIRIHFLCSLGIPFAYIFGAVRQTTVTFIAPQFLGLLSRSVCRDLAMSVGSD